MRDNTAPPKIEPEDMAPSIEEVQVEEIMLREERACFCLCTYNDN
jgi:hypothetical protein